MVADMKDFGLINHLRKWGLKVEEKDGWRRRGRPYNFYPKAIICHHTASGSQSGNYASESIVTYGRSDLPGPLCQFLLGRDGTVKVIADGYANHAGYGGPRAGMPENQGNTYSVGIEAENNGVGEPWGNVQLQAYYRLCAALMKWLDITDVNQIIGHKEWTNRKIDPAGIDMNKFRANVKAALNHKPNAPTIRLSRLQPGKRNKDVLKVKNRLTKKGFSINDNKSHYFGKGMKHDYKHWQKHLGYDGSDADGVPGKASLKAMGFNVKP